MNAHLSQFLCTFSVSIFMYQVAEPYLQVDRAANCIEKTLDAFGCRQLEISDVWEHYNISKEINIVLEKVMAENNEVSVVHRLKVWKFGD